jgi:hypothetical protein
MRAAILSMLLTLVGCSPGAALELVESLSDGDTAEARGLLTADARLETSDGTIVGQDAVHAALSALPPGGEASGHHDVAQLVMPDALLFAMGSDAVHSLALLEGNGSDDAPAALGDYVAAWSEPDAARREVLLGVFAVGGRYVDPTVDAVGREAFVAHLTAFRASQPGTTFERTSRIRRAGDWYLFDWVMRSGGSTTPGTDVVELDGDGRVRLVAGFF